MTRRQLFAALAGAPVAAAVAKDPDVIDWSEGKPIVGDISITADVRWPQQIPSLFDAEGNALCATRVVIGRFPDSYNLTRLRPPLNP